MPGSTNRGYPFPLGTEPADGSQNIEDLARAIDNNVTALEASTEALFEGMHLSLSGTRIVAKSTVQAVSASGGVTITYGYTFGTTRPVVLAVLGDEASAIGYVQMVEGALSATQFAVRVFNKNGSLITGGTVRINWIAIGAAP